MARAEGQHLHLHHQGAEAALPAQGRRDLIGTQPRLEGRRVLVVDDNATNRRILGAADGQVGHAPRDTESPGEALRWVAAGEPFDLAILDMHMPRDGRPELARRIREQNAALPWYCSARWAAQGGR